MKDLNVAQVSLPFALKDRLENTCSFQDACLPKGPHALEKKGAENAYDSVRTSCRRPTRYTTTVADDAAGTHATKYPRGVEKYSCS